MTDKIIPVVMCGGAGTRLWPSSRESRPKQFLPLMGDLSTFQQTLMRVKDPEIFGRPVVVTNATYRFLVAEQLSKIGIEADIVLEPSRRDSGPAVAAAAAFVTQRHGDAVICVLAADHVIHDVSGFRANCKAAASAAERGYLVTFGIRPDRAAVEYGYIKPAQDIGNGVNEVAQFVEKPDLATAQSYVEQGFLWNSGNFVFRADVVLDQYRAADPDSVNAVSHAVEHAEHALGFTSLDEEAFNRARAISFDYAVMERTQKAAVVPASFGWSDVGSWDAVWSLSDKDDAGNAGGADDLFMSSENSYVSSNGAKVVLLGMKNAVVVSEGDSILVADRECLADMRGVVAAVRESAPALVQDHAKVLRPWGSYQTLDRGSRFLVKRIVVKPGGRLSLQMHHHRAEHWVVVRGTAKVTVDDSVVMLRENESTYIPMGSVHRLENPGKIDLELIEIQSGSYLEEDDIVRIEDEYRRT